MKADKLKKNITLSFKIDEELNRRIEENADLSRRNKSNFVVNLLIKGLDDIERNNQIMR